MKLMLVLTILFSSLVFAQESNNNCTATKEFITAINYLRTKGEFALEESGVLKLSHEISKGCTDASARFIAVVDFLVKTGIDSKTAVETGTMFANQTNLHKDSFLSIFKYAYAADYLDLDLHAALKLSKELALAFPVEQAIIKKDFEAVAKFCVQKEGLDLPVIKCAELAKKIATFAAQNKSSLSLSFFDLFDYLKSEKGAGLTTGDALPLIEKILPFGTVGMKNFKDAHQFGLSKKGLQLDNSKSIELALELTKRSTAKTDK